MIRKDPHPRSITASGGKKIHKMALRSPMIIRFNQRTVNHYVKIPAYRLTKTKNRSRIINLEHLQLPDQQHPQFL